jgi:hypothetical protein
VLGLGFGKISAFDNETIFAHCAGLLCEVVFWT